MATINYPDFGTDFVNAKSPGKISGINNLVKKIVRRLKCPNGALYWDTAYGLDLRQYLNASVTTQKIQEIRQAVKTQCELDERVQTASVTVSNTANNQLFITIEITTQSGPNFVFILSVTQLTIDLLSINLAA